MKYRRRSAQHRLAADDPPCPGPCVRTFRAKSVRSRRQTLGRRVNMEETTLFYRVGDDFSGFSNFAFYPIVLQKQRWPTSEHYVQAQKFDSERHRDAIRKASSPMIAARMGRHRKKKLRRGWESMKVVVMREAVMAKFTQHEEPRELLVSTGEATIVEHAANDRYWGDGGDGSGTSMLRAILMETREQLSAQA